MRLSNGIIWRIGGLQAMAGLVTLLPLFVFDTAAFAGNTDALFYCMVLRLTAHHMALGDWLPGWLAEANGGVGSPALHYYNLLAYQLSAILGAPLASLDPFGWKRLALGMFFAQWVGGMAAWAWLSRHVSPRPAIIASLLFTLFPYKWVYIYLHINLAQLWALAWLPLLMMAAEDMCRGKRTAPVWYAVWLALIGLSHAPTLVATGGLPAVYVLCFSIRKWAYRLVPLLQAHILALLLIAFYLLPVALNFGLLQAGASNTGRMAYAGNLSHHDLMLNFHYAIVAALAIGLFARIPALNGTLAQKQLIFWVAALVVVTFLCLRVSQPLWDRLVLLQFLRFPVARFHAVALMAACMLSALFIEHHRNMPQLARFYSPSMLFATVAVMTAITLGYVGKIYSQANGIDWTYVERIHALNLILPSEYLTRWQPADGNSLDTAQRNAALPLAQIVKGAGTVDAHYDDNEHIFITTHIDSSEATVRVRQLFWPQWQSSEPQQESDSDGLMVLRVNSGAHEVLVEQHLLKGENAGRLLSLVAWIGTILFLARSTPQHL
jgi:hypothetical protein